MLGILVFVYGAQPISIRGYEQHHITPHRLLADFLFTAPAGTINASAGKSTGNKGNVELPEIKV